jgi:hypothetical protein
MCKIRPTNMQIPRPFVEKKTTKRSESLLIHVFGDL